MQEKIQQDLDLISFETKVRTLMRELIEPILNKGQKDREMILQLEKVDNDYEERLNILEASVFNKQLMNQRTKFDEIEEKFLETNILLAKLKDSMQSQIDDFTMKVNNYCFTID